MVWYILVKDDGKGNIESAVGVKELSPMDMLFTNIMFPVVYPSPEVLQALKDLIAQAKREEE